MADILQNVILGSIGVIVGLIGVFFGYGVFRLFLPIIGFFYGYILGNDWMGGGAWGFIIGLLFAIVLAILAYAYWSLLITIGGAVVGFGLGWAFGEWIGWEWLSWLAGIGLAIVFAALWFLFRDYMVMFVSAMAGAGIVMAGLATFWPWLFGWMANGGFAATILTIALGIVGFLAQMVIFATKHFYSEPPPGGPPYVYVPSSTAPAQ